MNKPTKNELLNMPNGTKIMTNSTVKGYNRFVKAGEDFINRENKLMYDFEINEDLTFSACALKKHGTKIIKIEKPHYETVWEEKEILDEKEKEYLSAVIKPFKKNVEYIKLKRGTNGNYILIMLKKYDECMLPYFKPGTMYKGMEANREYTLEELGL